MATVSMRRLVLLAAVASGAGLVLPGRPLHAPRRAFTSTPLTMSDIGKDYGGNAGGGERSSGRGQWSARQHERGAGRHDGEQDQSPH